MGSSTFGTFNSNNGKVSSTIGKVNGTAKTDKPPPPVYDLFAMLEDIVMHAKAQGFMSTYVEQTGDPHSVNQWYAEITADDNIDGDAKLLKETMNYDSKNS